MASRIAIVTTSYPAQPGDPSGHFVATEARALAAAGHDVTVIAGAGGAASSARSESPRVVRLADGGATGWPGVLPRLRERNRRGFGLLRWAFAAARELRRRGPFDRVIAHWLVPSAYPIALCSSLGEARLEVVVHGSDARLLARAPGVLARSVLCRLSRRGAHFRCVSAELAALLIRLAYPAELSTSVEAAPIDVGPRHPRQALRDALGISASARLVVIAGRMITAKRVHEALAAADLVPGLEVVALGDGPELSALRKAYPRVRFLGRLDRAAALAWIGAADAVLSASREEGSPTIVREARALGVPVVVAAAGDLLGRAAEDPGVFVVR